MLMKNIGFITTNKIFAQSFASTIKIQKYLDFHPFLLLNPKQASLDIVIMKIDIAVVDIVEMLPKILIHFLLFVRNCKLLNQIYVFTFASQDDHVDRRLAMDAVRNGKADDFVYYDTSLDYLFAKLEQCNVKSFIYKWYN